MKQSTCKSTRDIRRCRVAQVGGFTTIEKPQQSALTHTESHRTMHTRLQLGRTCYVPEPAALCALERVDLCTAQGYGVSVRAYMRLQLAADLDRFPVHSAGLVEVPCNCTWTTSTRAMHTGMASQNSGGCFR